MTLSNVITGIFSAVIIIVMVFGAIAFFKLLMGLFGALLRGGKGKGGLNAEGLGKGVGAALHGAGRGVGAAGEGVGKGAGALAGGVGKGTGAILKPLVPSASGVVTVGKAVTSGTGALVKGVGKVAKVAAWDASGKHVANYGKRKYKARKARKDAEKKLQKEIDDVVKEADKLVNETSNEKKAVNPFAATGIRWRFDSEEDAKRAGKILLNGGVVFGFDQNENGLFLVMPQTQTGQASEVFDSAGVKAVQAGEPCAWLADDQIVTEITNDDGTPYLLPDEQEEADAQALDQAIKAEREKQNRRVAEAEAEAEKVRKMKEKIDRQEAAKLAKEKRPNHLTDWQ